MRSVPAAQSQLQNVSVRSHAEVIPASTPITVSVVPAVHDPARITGSSRRFRPPRHRPRGLLLRPVHGRPGQHDRERRPAGDRQVAAHQRGRAAVDGGGLHDRARQPAAVLRRRGGQDRPAHHLPGRPEPVHARVVAVQPRPVPVLADRLPRAAGDRREHAQPGGARHHHQRLQRADRTGPRPSASGTASPACPWRSGRWPAASSSAPSAGAASSGRTSPSAWPRSRSPRCSCPTPRPSGAARPTRSARSW